MGGEITGFSQVSFHIQIKAVSIRSLGGYYETKCTEGIRNGI